MDEMIYHFGFASWYRKREINTNEMILATKW